ncbi:MAG: lysoplasmalogenase [Myxococcota bacterium]|nr:lysoplasmalogenase [Myxococcota bacterium]
MSVLAFTATAMCGWACVVLVLMERRLARSPDLARNLEQVRIASKCIAAACFVSVGAAALGRGGAFATWMVVGLAFGAIGDVALLGRGSRAFLAGLGAFLVGHLAYVIGIAQLVPPERWPGGAGLSALPVLAIGGGALAYLWPRLGSLKVPVTVYVGAIVAMVIGAIAARHALPTPRGMLLVVGALLFFASDLAVARDRFVARSFTNKLWGLPAYFAGQLLIAWAIR